MSDLNGRDEQMAEAAAKIQDRFVGTRLDPRNPDALQEEAADAARSDIIDQRKAEADKLAGDPIDRMLACYDRLQKPGG